MTSYYAIRIDDHGYPSVIADAVSPRELAELVVDHMQRANVAIDNIAQRVTKAAEAARRGNGTSRVRPLSAVELFVQAR